MKLVGKRPYSSPGARALTVLVISDRARSQDSTALVWQVQVEKRRKQKVAGFYPEQPRESCIEK